MPILVGAVIDGPGRFISNTAIVWDPESGPGDTYLKRHPVPFGEYIPYRSFFRVFSAEVDRVRRDFAGGDEPGVLDVGGDAGRRPHLLRGGLRRPGRTTSSTAAPGCSSSRPTTRRSASPTRARSSWP